MTIKDDAARGPTVSADADEDEYSSSLEAASPDEQEIQAGLAEAALVLVQTMQEKWDQGDRDAPTETDSRGPWTALLAFDAFETATSKFFWVADPLAPWRILRGRALHRNRLLDRGFGAEQQTLGVTSGATQARARQF